MTTEEKDFQAWLRWNCSALFLLKPISGLHISNFDSYGIVNTFLSDVEKEYEGDYLFVLLKPTDMAAMEALVQVESTENENFVEDYDYEGGYVVILYSVPFELKSDYELFKEGKYSLFSERFKALHQFVLEEEEKEPCFQYMVMYKNKKLKETLEKFFGTRLSSNSEYWQKPQIETKEVLDISKIKEKENEESHSVSSGEAK